MAMLNERLDECVGTLDRERMAVEIIFRLGEGEDDFLFWVTVKGVGGMSGFLRGHPGLAIASTPMRDGCLWSAADLAPLPGVGHEHEPRG